MGQKLLAIAQIVDEMYDAVVNQQDVLLGGHYILPDSRHSTGGERPPVNPSPRQKAVCDCMPGKLCDITVTEQLRITVKEIG
ncbi:TPA: hypothetical protein L6746_005008 [Escherichia coli]|jgi:hypothetical protein|uniref:hypothetical protein n=1 Tax=Escherichia TaxID=561 RepID=UPI000DA5AAE2|nr:MULTISPECIES: hypothetical protein [Escherichia]EEZ9682320.1 hypothetical protein [Escherichia coli O55]EFC4567470.1 hypothetical protein [Escherichia coli]EFC7693848.1 hypothetical protein [Escherichia coli]EFH7663831.1 hypothetical protein [Escherichia coli]EFJ8615031.1 hypothetical protein [Escherichia coli]